MKNENILDAIGMINEEAVREAKAYRQSKSRTWAKWGAVAACLCLVVALVHYIGNYNENPGGTVAAIPYVKINDMIYTIDPNYTTSSTAELSDEYVSIGEVLRNPSSNNPNEIINGDAAGCKVGDKIFKSPYIANEIFVYTTLFSGSGEYRYVRFVCDID